MRIRIPFTIAFFVQVLLAAYLTFSSIQPPINDKVGHFLTFFILTLTFYWILETTRRRALNLTFIIITLITSTTCEFLQPFMDPTDPFDPYDILSNMLGSLSALGLAAWYHKRMLERKRERSKSRYTALATTADGDGGDSDPNSDLDHDLELELDVDVERGEGDAELGDLEAEGGGRREGPQSGDGKAGV